MFICGHLKHRTIMSGCGAEQGKTIKETDPAILLLQLVFNPHIF